ncbi:hypothetical protein FP744_10006412 [Trichoderma asperellum]|nr:hypothetical protein LI328DRAFT_166961 [Trichoderma asperelloides]
MENKPFNEPLLATDGSSTESDSNSAKIEDTKRPSLSIPSNIPPVVLDKIKSQDNPFPIDYYNLSLDPKLEEFFQGAFPSSIFTGRWTYNNLPQFGDIPHPFAAILTQGPSSANKESDKSTVQRESSCCYHQNLLPCVRCALRLQDGDLRALCRKDVVNETETCVECAYAGRTCTWAGFKPYEEGIILVRARLHAIQMVARHGLDDSRSKLGLQAMQTAAAQYLAAFWRDGDIYDLIGVQCLYNSSNARKQRALIQRKNNNRKRIQRGTGNEAGKEDGKDAEMSLFLNQGFGLMMGHLLIIREMMNCNRKISETLQKNNEILHKLLGSQKPLAQAVGFTEEESEGHGTVPEADVA